MVLGGPLPHVIAAKAVALTEASQPSFRTYAQAIVDNARALADGLQRRGAAVVSGGTDNHLVLLDVRSFGLTGRQAELAMQDAGVVANRNSVPFDPNGAWYTSGVRLGTPATTTLGMGPAEMDEIADIICTVLSATQPTAPSSGPSKARYTVADGVAEQGARRSAELLARHPLYPSITLD
jgi:glycine hydroxymethyltransferase